MKYRNLISNNLCYYKRSHIGVLIGTAISTAVLVGALIIGDSVRYSLRMLTLNHIGKTEITVTSGDRFFRSALSDAIKSNSIMTAPVIHSQGVAIAHGGKARINNAQVYGVTTQFWKFAEYKTDIKSLKPGQALINFQLAERLKIKTGDTLLLRINKPSAIANATPLTDNQNSKISVRLEIINIINKKEFGDFSTRITQTAPLNIFISLADMGDLLNHKSSANLLLTASKTEQPITTDKLERVFKETWKLKDAELNLTTLSGTNELELTSDRVLLNKTETDAALTCGTNGRAIFTYFVNSICTPAKCTPYSFITGLNTEKLNDNEIIISKWMANDINADINDSINLKYFVAGALGSLHETNRYFKVRVIKQIAGSPLMRQLTPDFPGLSDAENCKDWDTSLPIDLKRIRKKDEDYWNNYGATPKAFITLHAAQSMWQNQFGNATAIRFPGDKNNITNIAAELISKLNPSTLGFQFIPIREQALSAGEKSVDFGQLFIGLSFFLIVAAIMLTGMLFVLAIEKRREEIATLLSLGYTARIIKRLLLAEAFVPAFAGAIVGTAGGILYTEIVLYALGSIWRGAVGTSAIQSCILPTTLITGCLIGLFTAILSIWISLSTQIKHGITGLYTAATSTEKPKARSRIINIIIISISTLAAIIIAITIPADAGMKSAGAFFAVGSLLLIAGLSACRLLLQYLYQSTSLKHLSMNSLSLRNISRQQGRSLTAIAILASGIFLVIAVASNRKDPNNIKINNHDGTGGFSLYGELTIPIVANLNNKKTQRDLGLDIPLLADTEYIQIHAKDGDDASCLNLNHISNPRIISINPEIFNSRQSFTFVKLLTGLNKNNPWLSTLGNNTTETNNIIPAVADMEAITWSLGKKLGDAIDYTDDYGKKIKLKLVGGLENSIFQGNIIISEKDFRKHFPSDTGTRIILINTSEQTGTSEKITLALEDYGLELENTRQRLAEFNTIQNTYLSIFLILGGLGIILGTAGLGIVVARNINDRRQELAIMRAVGYKQKELYQLLLREHIILLMAGTACGSIAGISAMLPAMISAGGAIPYKLLTIILLAIIANGILCISLAAAISIRGNLFTELRRE